MAKRTKKQSRPAPRFRASWKGPIRFGLVTFEVQAINAEVKDKSEIHFHLLHEADHQRIHYAKICPKHGEVSKDEIVEGFEFRKGHYIEVEKEELDALRTSKERALTIDAFVAPEAIDPLYFDGRMYYLLPVRQLDHEAYSLLASAMERLNRYGVGQVVFSGREQLALLRSNDGVLMMAMLNYAAGMRQPSEMKRDLAAPKRAGRMLKLAEELIENGNEENFDLGAYKDRYREKVQQLLESKRKGKEIVVPEEEEEPHVINLLDALKRSVKVAERGSMKGAKSRRAAHSTRRPSRRKRRA